jgi:hypothetical protein
VRVGSRIEPIGPGFPIQTRDAAARCLGDDLVALVAHLGYPRSWAGLSSDCFGDVRHEVARIE